MVFFITKDSLEEVLGKTYAVFRVPLARKKKLIRF
jgi:hypothetical protein